MNAPERLEENRIIEKCLNGDGEDYALLVDRYKDMACTIACRMMGDWDAAKDMAQESFIAAYANLKNFRRESRFSSWLCSIVINKCRDQLRAGKRSVSIDEVHERASSSCSPEQAAAGREAGDALQKALCELPVEYREVIILKHMEGLEYREITEILGGSVNALKVRAHRGRELLRHALEEKGVVV